MGPYERSCGEHVAVKRGSSFNVKSSWCDLPLVKDGTEKASFLIIAVGRAALLEFQLCATRRRVVHRMVM
jgi:hypothetical protein